MRPSQQRYHTSLEKYHVGNIATNRKGKKRQKINCTFVIQSNLIFCQSISGARRWKICTRRGLMLVVRKKMGQKQQQKSIDISAQYDYVVGQDQDERKNDDDEFHACQFSRMVKKEQRKRERERANEMEKGYKY